MKMPPSECPDADAPSFDTKPECFHKMILDFINVGILVTDRDAHIKYVNPAFAEMYSLKPDDVIEKKVKELFPASRLDLVMKTGKPDKVTKCSFQGRDALINRYPIMSNGEVCGGLVKVFFRDINFLKDLLQRLNILEKKVLYYKQKTAGLPKAKYVFDDIIGGSEPIESLKKLGERFAHSSRPVLIMGESGTGKELVAHSVHAASPRSAETFISINCAAIPKDLLESELFGFEEGAFSGAKAGGKVGKFEIADRGTIFLDEIGDLPLEMQAKLLRVIENGEIQKIGSSAPISSDFRLIAATNKDLVAAAAAGTFREDLYHRLNMLVLRVPPLRERAEDVLPIAHHLMGSISQGPNVGPVSISPEVGQLFQAYPWPGNIRELKNCLCFAIFSLDEGQSEIKLRNIPPYLLEKGVKCVNPLPYVPTPLCLAREKGEKEALVNALELTGSNKVRTAQLLGVSRNEVYKKMRKYGLMSKVS
ncbi:MAG: sigma-54 interaction domain-containing protein [Syntrophobacteraceae bacterium]